MDDIGRFIWGSAGLLILLFIAMFYAAAGTTIKTLHGSDLKYRMEEEDDKKAEALYAIKQKQSAFTVFSGTVTVLFLGATLVPGTFLYAELLETLFPALSMRGAELITALILLYLLVLIGWLLPKKFASYRAEVFGNFMTPVLHFFNPLLYVLVAPAYLPANLIVRMFGFDPKNTEREKVSEEEISMLVDTGEESGAIEMSEREMINNVFEFDDRTAAEIMTHRTEVCAVYKEESVAEVLRMIMEEGFSRIPVYDDGVDDIIGVIYAKDLLVLAGCTDIESKPLTDYIHEVIYVPESTRCRQLFKQFKETKQHMAVIVDEYGGTAGIATMEDLLESIVGEIQDEYDSEEEEILKNEDGSYSLDGSLSIEKTEELLETELSDEDNDTLGGFVMTLLGRIPEEDETPSVTVEGWQFTVTEMEDRRILRVLAQCVRKEEETEDEE